MNKLNLQQFAAPGLTTPIRADTFKKLQLNAGVFIKDFVFEGITDATALKAAIVNIITGGSNPAGELIGATRGGGNFNVTKQRRTPDIDGMRYPFKGSQFVDSADAYIATTLVEVTPDNFVLALATGEKSASGKITTVKMHTAVEDDDYLTNMCWAGDLADGRLVLIVLENALNNADMQFTFTDKGEGTIGVEFHAYQDDVDDYDIAPFSIVFFDKAST